MLSFPLKASDQIKREIRTALPYISAKKNMMIIAFITMFFNFVDTARAVTCVEIWLMPGNKVPINALEICRQEAMQGNAWAQAHMASAYANGMLGARKDDSEAFKWSRMAEAQGSTDVLSYLFNAYYNGKATPVDLIEAFKYKVLEIEHATKRYPNESSYFGKDVLSQPMGRASLVFDVRLLKDLLDKLPEDAVVEAYTRADRWDEDHGFKKFSCLSGESLCAPEKLK